MAPSVQTIKIGCLNNKQQTDIHTNLIEQLIQYKCEYNIKNLYHIHISYNCNNIKYTHGLLLTINLNNSLLYNSSFIYGILSDYTHTNFTVDYS